MRKTFTLLIALLALTVSSWATQIEWGSTELATLNLSMGYPETETKEINGVTVSLSYQDQWIDNCYFNSSGFSLNNNGALVFASESGILTSIVITCDAYNPPLEENSGWEWDSENPSLLTWTGSASSVVLKSNSSNYLSSGPISSIVFTISGTVITWEGNDLESVNVGMENGAIIENANSSQEVNGITITANAPTPENEGYNSSNFSTADGYTNLSVFGAGSLTFAPASGKLAKIVITCDMASDVQYINNGDGWLWDETNKKLTWKGDAASVVLTAPSYGCGFMDISSVKFIVTQSEEPGDDPVVENKTATSVVIEGGNYYQGQFTLMDNDCGTLGAYTLPNVYLRESELLNTISEKSLTITSSDESVVAVSLSDFIDGEHIYRTIQFVQKDYGHAVITVSFAGDETYASSQASFDYYYLRNTSPMAACHVQDLEGNTHTDLVMTEGDKIALDFVRTDGNAMCYFHIGTATTTQKSCWKYDEEISHRVFYPHAAGLDTIVYEYFRSNSLDEQVDKKEDFHYWPYRQTIKIPVTIMPYLTPVSYCVETTMELDPEGNANLSFSKTADDLFNSTANQLEIKSVVSAENLQLALDSMATGTKEWNDILPGATTFNVDAGRGKIKIECQTVEGYELRVLIRNGGTATITQPTMGIAELSYDVDEVSAVLVYLWRTTGGSPAPKRAPAAIKEDAPKAIIKSITITPGVDIVPNQDPDNSGVYYSTFYDGSYKYALPNDGTKAFVAKINGSDMIMTQIAENDEIIPANTAVILQSPTGSFSLTPSDGSEVTFTPSDNQLLGVDEATAAPANCYVLSGHSTDNSVTGVGFYEFTGTIPAHKAYLTISGGAAYAPKKLRFVFNNEQQATGIDNAADGIMSEKRFENGQLIIIKNGVRYNAQGQIVK